MTVFLVAFLCCGQADRTCKLIQFSGLALSVALELCTAAVQIGATEVLCKLVGIVKSSCN